MLSTSIIFYEDLAFIRNSLVLSEKKILQRDNTTDKKIFFFDADAYFRQLEMHLTP